jgi:hypothetical protein
MSLLLPLSAESQIENGESMQLAQLWCAAGLLVYPQAIRRLNYLIDSSSHLSSQFLNSKCISLNFLKQENLSFKVLC